VGRIDYIGSVYNRRTSRIIGDLVEPEEAPDQASRYARSAEYKIAAPSSLLQ
jgi:hypothetical protein